MTLKPPTRTFPKLAMKEWPERGGFFASLSPEQQKAALEYRGDENHGDERFSRKALSDCTRVVEEMGILDQGRSQKEKSRDE